MTAIWSTYNVGAIAAGEGDVILRRRLWKPKAVTPLIYCHSAASTVWTQVVNPAASPPSSATNAEVRKLLDRLADLNIPVIANDQNGANNWGADPTPARVDAALARVAAETGARTDRVLLMGMSMGTVVSLNWARANWSKVAAIALMLPVVNLEQIHDSGPAPIPANIESAYGGLSAYNAVKVSRNPQANALAYKGVPIKFWYHSDDPVALSSEVLAFCATSGAASVNMGTGGHALSTADDLSGLVDFLAAHA